MIEIVNGSFGYEDKDLILNNISFSIEDSEIMTILGQNGIGKTTLLKCLIGLYKWNEGYASFNGEKITSMKGNMKYIGYVPQVHSLAFSYTVREIITMGRAKFIGMFGLPSTKDKEKVEMAMEEVGITHLADKSCTQLSGGQLQLTFIARALAGEPKVIILDEPESYLDFKNQFIILKLIKKLVKEKNMSAIINTHYPEHALNISDKTLLLGKNKYEFGNTHEVINEKNIENYFGVKAKIIDVPHDNLCTKAFVVIDSL